MWRATECSDHKTSFSSVKRGRVHAKGCDEKEELVRKRSVQDAERQKLRDAENEKEREAEKLEQSRLSLSGEKKN